MALLRSLRLSGYVLDHAVDWDRRVDKWRVEVRFNRQRIMWNWVGTIEAATRQRWYAEGRRRR